MNLKKKSLKGYNGGALTETELRYLDQIALKPYDYKHGITPPLYNARNRRFRRKMGLDEFEYTEQAVERLLKQDDQSEEVTYELVDEDEVARRSTSAANLEQFSTSARDETGISGYADDEKEEDDLDLDAAFQSDEDAEAEAAAKTNDLFDEAGDDVEQYNGEEDEEEDEEDEEDEEEDNDEEDDAGSDHDVVHKEEVNEGRQHNELLKDELLELKTTLDQTIQKLQTATNPLLKSRFVESIKKLEKEVELKRKQLKYSDESLQGDSSVASQINGTQEEFEEEENDADADDDDDDDDDIEAPEEEEGTDHVPDQELDQNDLDMMMLFGAEGDEADAD